MKMRLLLGALLLLTSSFTFIIGGLDLKKCITGEVTINTFKDFEKAVVKSESKNIQKLIEGIEKTDGLLTQVKAHKGKILKLATRVSKVRGKKALVEGSKAKQHVKNMAGGGSAMLVGTIELVWGVYNGDWMSGILGGGTLVGGGYYLVNGLIKRTPKIKAADAKKVLAFLQVQFPTDGASQEKKRKVKDKEEV